jgi:hypothetical protein
LDHFRQNGVVCEKLDEGTFFIAFFQNKKAPSQSLSQKKKLKASNERVMEVKKKLNPQVESTGRICIIIQTATVQG